MPNREKVLAWLKICGEDWDCSKSCPYYNVNEVEIGCMGALMNDAAKVIEEQTQHIWNLAVEKKELRDRLKEQQEAIEPEAEILNEIDRIYRCPKCHKAFFYKNQKYCDRCGQKVKWND